MALQGSSILVEVLADQHCKVVKHRLRQRVYRRKRNRFMCYYSVTERCLCRSGNSKEGTC